MNPTEFDQLDAVDHWNLAVDAEDAEDYLTAIAEYDACLCSTPDADVTLEAFYRLGLMINRAYDSNTEALTSEQLGWRYCELACCEQAITIYETYPDLWAQYPDLNAKEIYFEVQAILGGVGGSVSTPCLPKAQKLQLL